MTYFSHVEPHHISVTLSIFHVCFYNPCSYVFPSERAVQRESPQAGLGNMFKLVI